MAKKPSHNPNGRPITAPGPIGALAKAMKGMGNLADALGVDRTTPGRWAKDLHVPRGKKLREDLEKLFVKYGIEERPW